MKQLLIMTITAVLAAIIVPPASAQGDPLPVRLTVTGFDDAPVAGVEVT